MPSKIDEAADCLGIMADALGIKTIGNLRAGVRSEIRRYWTGAGDESAFIVGMGNVIERQYTEAWRIGAADCGIKPDEYSDGEKAALQAQIDGQFTFILDLADLVGANLKKDGGKLGPIINRADLWAARYEEVVNRARAMACANKKLKWVIGVAEHCSSCLKLNGQVRRGSFWDERGILPRVAGAGYLECRGYQCKCSLQPTDAPLSRGRLPSLP